MIPRAQLPQHDAERVHVHFARVRLVVDDLRAPQSDCSASDAIRTTIGDAANLYLRSSVFSDHNKSE